jgi:hypothetical protein
MPRKRRHAWVGFALCAALAILGLFVLGGILAGVTLFVTMIAFILVCIYALRAEDPGDGDRTGLIGFFGGWL